MTQRRLQDLPREACFTLLSQEVVGRLVYVDDLGPVAIPVNYALDAETVVFRIEAGSKARALQGPVAFEVDQIDHAEKAGWSVLLRGTCHELDIELVPALLKRITDHFPRPWAAGQHNCWVSLVPGSVTGRQLAAPFFAPVF
ncbi:MAG TPA: pyridoxamine 5'-phosphate oxidase family protein [Acidimicrobiales bacterium]|nr:pyridoxamine 5'-phosphate oxidase family protein [Acidimicrobiales bacterium]